LGGAVPGTTAGEGRPTTPSPAALSPWDCDPTEAEAFVPAFGVDEQHIANLVAKHLRSEP